ncbi:uncharacterized protein ACB058_006231 isoform 1-T2 [Synchiropus picturatus]
MPMELLEGMSSRKRRPNWTDRECLFLIQLMQERRDVIRGKCNAGVTVIDKRQAWEEISLAINTAFPQYHRTVSDCSKKWENLLAKTREEIKRQKRQVGEVEGVCLEQLSTVTRAVISVVNCAHQQQREMSPISSLVEAEQNSCDNDGNPNTQGERFTIKHHQGDLSPSAYSDDPSVPLVEHKVPPFLHIPKLLPVQYQHGMDYSVGGDPADTPSSSYAPSAAVQERMDLEMSVLRRQDAVLKLQEEYYTLKIKKMKRKMEEDVIND